MCAGPVGCGQVLLFAMMVATASKVMKCRAVALVSAILIVWVEQGLSSKVGLWKVVARLCWMVLLAKCVSASEDERVRG